MMEKMKPWLLVDTRSTTYSYRFTVAEDKGDYLVVKQHLSTGNTQEMNLVKLASHIKLYVGLMGTKGSGKGTVGRFLEGKGAAVVTSHSVVAGILRQLGIPEYRDSLQGLGNYLGLNWPVVWVNEIIKQCNKSGKSIVVFDGVRFPHDVVLPRLAAGGKYGFGPDSYTLVEKGRAENVLVDADERIRRERITNRGNQSGRVEDLFGYSSFREQEFNEFKVFWFDLTMTMADHVVTNNDTEGELVDKIKTVWDDMAARNLKR